VARSARINFQVERLDVASRVDGLLDVDDVLVLETPHHMDDQFGLADVVQELIAQTLATARAFGQAGDVHEFDVA